MLRFLRIKLGIQRIYGIPFTSFLLFGLFAPRFLRVFPLMCCNQIGQQCVAKRVCLLLLPFSFLFLYSCCLVCFYGRIPHPSFVLLNSINIFHCHFLSKKKKMLISAVCINRSRHSIRACMDGIYCLFKVISGLLNSPPIYRWHKIFTAINSFAIFLVFLQGDVAGSNHTGRVTANDSCAESIPKSYCYSYSSC